MTDQPRFRSSPLPTDSRLELKAENLSLKAENALLLRALFEGRSCTGHHSIHETHPVVIIFRDPEWGWLAFCAQHLAMSPRVKLAEHILAPSFPDPASSSPLRGSRYE